MTRDPRRLDADRLDVEARRLRLLAGAIVGNDHDGEDIAQEAWVTALERPVRAGWSTRSWLAGIVRNHARQHRRTGRRRTARERAAARPEAVAVDDSIERLDLLRHLLAQVRELAEPYRTTILLRFVEGHDPGEVARSLGVPHATVRTRIRRGIELLRARMDASVDGGRSAWLVPLATFSLPDAAMAATVVPGSAAASWSGAARWIASTTAWITMKKTTLALVATGAVLAVAVPLLTSVSSELSSDPPTGTIDAESSRASVPATAALGSEVEAAGDVPRRIEVGGSAVSERSPHAMPWIVRGLVRDEQGRAIGGAEVRVVASGERSVPDTAADKKKRAVARAKTDKAASLPGPEIALPRDGDPATTVSESDGSFVVTLVLGDPSAQTWIWVGARADHHLPDVEVFPRVEGSVLEVQLVRAVSVVGDVRDERGAPIARALVWMTEDAQAPVRSDANGAFRLAGIDPRLDVHYVQASAAGYVSAGRVVEIDVEAPRVSLVLQRASRIAGVVVSAGQPVARAKLSVRVDKTVVQASSDEDGAFTLEGLRPGLCTLSVEHPEFVAQSLEIDVPPPGNAGTLTIELRAGRALTGTVADVDGKPVAGARVAVRRGDDAMRRDTITVLRHTATDRTGAFELSGLPPEDLVVDCFAQDFAPLASVPAPHEVERLELTLHAGTTLRGRVTAIDGEPLAGARVRLVPPAGAPGSAIKGRTARTDSDGAYELPDVAAGEWRLVVEHPDCLVFVEPIEVPEGVLVWEENVELHVQGTLRGVVRAPTGEAVPAARVQLKIVDVPGVRRTSRDATADHLGRFSFSNLAPGVYELRHLEPEPGADGKSLWQHAMRVTVAGRGTHVVELVAAGTGRVRGTLRAAVALPSWTYVQLVPISDEGVAERRAPRWARVRDGAFAFEQVGSGRYEVRVEFVDPGTSQRMLGSETIRVPEGERVDTVLALAPVTGR